MIGSIFTIIGVSLLALLAVPIETQLRLSGIFPSRAAEEARVFGGQPSAAQCRTIHALGSSLSCESFAVNDAFGIAYLACETVASRRAYNPALFRMPYEYSGYGAVYALHLKTEKLVKLSFSDLNANVSILGIDFTLKDANTALISIINHHPAGARIDTFFHSKNSPSLSFLRSFSSPALLNWPNSIAIADSLGSFYVTSGLTNKDRFSRTAEQIFPLGQGSVVYYNAKSNTAHIVANKDLNFPNGIAISPDGRYIYVSTTNTGAIHIFRRIHDETTNRNFLVSPNEADQIEIQNDENENDTTEQQHSNFGRLKFVEKVQLDFYVDNLSVNRKTGAIYVAGFANGLHAFLAMSDHTGTDTATTLVAKITNNTGEAIFYGHKFKKDLVFVGKDQIFSMISQAAVVDVSGNEKTIFGSLFPSSKGGAAVVCDWSF
ncbi:hypothetical protein HK100_008846 [Physocladia obscura]|uniref:Uncharacterized protein n=1 Tax=Physocladia obscura TaxID=109957 RepID=A0AAD5T699_9FUNG|nr:hypothetical protein HK100_008846 [Physocladia obscura]